jgi:hypothetical protein
MKFVRKILMVVLLLVVAWWLFRRLDIIPSFSKIFSPKEVVIDQTPLVIQQIRPLAQLATITAYTEVAADTTAPTSAGDRLKDIFNPFSLQVATTRKLVVVGKITVHAGVNLQKLRPEAIYANGDSVSIQLPPAEILDVILNPSGTEVFVEEGRWENVAVSNLKTTLQNKAVADLKSRGVLFQAEERAREVLTAFFLAAGYRKVNIVKARLS